MWFVLGAKPGDHNALFEWVEQLDAHPQADPAKRMVRYKVVDGDGATHSFRWLNGVPLNDTHFDLEVNFLDDERGCRGGHGNGRSATRRPTARHTAGRRSPGS